MTEPGIASATDITGELIAPFSWDDVANIQNQRERMARPVSGLFARAMERAHHHEIMVRAAVINQVSSRAIFVNGGPGAG